MSANIGLAMICQMRDEIMLMAQMHERTITDLRIEEIDGGNIGLCLRVSLTQPRTGVWTNRARHSDLQFDRRLEFIKECLGVWEP